MNFEEYRAIKAINFSSLKHMRKSPKSFKHELANNSPSTVGRDLGKATHCLVLEPEKFNNEFAVYTGKIRKGKDWDTFVKEHQRQTILKESEYEQCSQVAREVRSNPIVVHLLSSGKPEHTITWKDRTNGLDCKARLDFLSDVDGRLTILDLKGVTDIRNERFRIEAGRNFYHGQMAWYREGVSTVYGEIADCLILGVEHKAPFDSAVFKFEEESLDYGWFDCCDMMQRVLSCQQSNTWPGCYDSIQPLAIRKWELGSNPEDDIEEIGLDFGTGDEQETL